MLSSSFEETGIFKNILTASIFVPLSHGAAVNVTCSAAIEFCSFSSRRKFRGKDVVADAYFNTVYVHLVRKIFHYGSFIREEENHLSERKFPATRRIAHPLSSDTIGDLRIQALIGMNKERSGYVVSAEEYKAYRDSHPDGGGLWFGESLPKNSHGNRLPLVRGKIFVPDILMVEVHSPKNPEVVPSGRKKS